MEDGFQISDNGQPEVDIERFHSATRRMKDDVEDAITRLLGNEEYFFVDPLQKGNNTLVDGAKRNSREGYNTNLCLRIDLQSINTEKVNGKDNKFANVQIQLNIKERPSTIAQVHFVCGQNIPEDVIRRAFEKSYTERRVIYVYK